MSRPAQDALPPGFAAVMACLGIAGPVACLCWLRGGVGLEVYAPVFGVVLVLAGLLLWGAPHPGEKTCSPWTLVAVALLPLLQLAPLGPARALLWQPWRQELAQAFSRFGMEADSAISLYPLATLRVAVVLAGCCALLGLARTLARRGSAVKGADEAVVGVIAVLLATAAGEAVLGLTQAIWGGLLASTAGGLGTARGTFVNRDHFAVLLEAGFCLGVGLAGYLSVREQSYFPGRSPPRLAIWASQLAAGLCLVGVAASGSRMGILAGCALALGSSLVYPRGAGRRFRVAPVGIAALFFVVALNFPNTAQGLVRLAREGGDRGRVAVWSDALTTAARHFPAGSGLGTFSFAFRRGEPYFLRNTVDHAHCDWLEFLVELGLPGTLLLAGAIGLMVARSWRRSNRGASDPLDPLRMACVLAALAVLAHSSVDFPLRIPALAALFAVLLGCASGLADRQGPAGAALAGAPSAGSALDGTAAAAGRRLVALGCWSFALVAIAVCGGEPRAWDPEPAYQRGQRELLAGRGTAADVDFRESLAANPYSALAWQKRAEVAQLHGERDNEIELLQLASRLEPFTFRTEWPAAQALLRRQRWQAASRRLRRLAEALPDMRPAVFDAAIRAGLPAALMAASVVPDDAAGVWLRVLVDREAWDGFDQTLARWANPGGFSVPTPDLRYVFDTLFQQHQPGRMKSLWRVVRGTDAADPFGLWLPPSPARHRARGPLSLVRSFSSPGGRAGGDRGGPEESTPITGRLASGFGFAWVFRPAPGILLRIHGAPPAGPCLELDIRSSAAGESVPLSLYIPLPYSVPSSEPGPLSRAVPPSPSTGSGRHCAVRSESAPQPHSQSRAHTIETAPGAGYDLAVQAMAESPVGETVRLELWSDKRLLAVSEVARCKNWRMLSVPFQPDRSEEVLQLRVVTRTAPGREMRGRFFLGTIAVRPADGSGPTS